MKRECIFFFFISWWMSYQRISARNSYEFDNLGSITVFWNECWFNDENNEIITMETKILSISNGISSQWTLNIVLSQIPYMYIVQLYIVQLYILVGTVLIAQLYRLKYATVLHCWHWVLFLFCDEMMSTVLLTQLFICAQLKNVGSEYFFVRKWLAALFDTQIDWWKLYLEKTYGSDHPLQFIFDTRNAYDKLFTCHEPLQIFLQNSSWKKTLFAGILW